MADATAEWLALGSITYSAAKTSAVHLPNLPERERRLALEPVIREPVTDAVVGRQFGAADWALRTSMPSRPPNLAPSHQAGATAATGYDPQGLDGGASLPLDPQQFSNSMNIP
jgi:hypothetical protein